THVHSDTVRRGGGRGVGSVPDRRRGGRYWVRMEAAWIARARWRWRGAWLWPTFVVAAFLDGGIARVRPSVGDRTSVSGWRLAGLDHIMLAVRFVSRGLLAVLRPLHGDMPV